MADPRAIPETPLPEPIAPLPLVPEGGFFEGQIALVSDTWIEGRVAGSLRGSGRLAVGPHAHIDGMVECDELEIRGTVIGPIEARERASLGPGARVDGDVVTPALEVADEAVWNGAARIGRPTSDAATTEPPRA